MNNQTPVDRITLESLFFRINAMESKYEEVIADKDAKYGAIIADKDAQILKLTHELAQLKKNDLQFQKRALCSGIFT